MLNVTHIIQSGGLVLLGVFLYAEVALFLGFFLPGDTLLIAAGIYAMQGNLNVVAVIIVAAVAATAGDSSAYFTGRKLGPRVFRRDDSIFFRKEHIQKAERFYERHGSKTVLIAHFLPVVRAFSPLIAGVAKMPYSRYFPIDVIGNIAWAIIITLAGYYVGSRIPNIDHYILISLVLVIVVSLVPTIYQISKHTLKRRAAARAKNSVDEPEDM